MTFDYKADPHEDTTPDRLAKNKNLTMFHEDLKNNALPQWVRYYITPWNHLCIMLTIVKMFITPNMTSDGHDSSVTVAGAWVESFLGPLLNDSRFMQNTLVLVTFE